MRRYRKQILVIAIALLLIPRMTIYIDGGTKVYQAVLWSYIDYNRIEQGFENDVDDDGFLFFPYNWLKEKE